MKVNIIVAHDDAYGIGKCGTIPWKSVEDLKHFKSTTDCHVLLMGINTFNSLRTSTVMNIVKTRKIIVLSTKYDVTGINLYGACSYNEAKTICKSLGHETMFVCGGEEIYKTALSDDDLCNVYITEISGNFDCDKFFKYKDHLNHLSCVYKSNISENAVLSVFQNKSEEFQYLDLLKEILIDGKYFNDRTNTGIYSLFGKTMTFHVKNNFPLLTTKKTFFRGITEELLWFMQGCTDSKILNDKGVYIWKGNTSREFLDAQGFIDREVGDIGPGYGHQWRHYNSPYYGCSYDYTNLGIDQLQNCIDNITYELQSKIHNRRNIMIAWNPEQIREMSLPPCHILVQFYLDCQTKDLSLHMYQRSADMFLGEPFNIASYALLLYIVCDITGCYPDKLVISIGDCHIYSNHVKQVKTQLTREPHKFPQLKIKSKNDKTLSSYTYNDFELCDYVSHPIIKAEMAV